MADDLVEVSSWRTSADLKINLRRLAASSVASSWRRQRRCFKLDSNRNSLAEGLKVDGKRAMLSSLDRGCVACFRRLL